MKEFMIHTICGVCLIILAVGLILITMDDSVVKGSGFGMGCVFLLSFGGYLWYLGVTD